MRSTTPTRLGSRRPGSAGRRAWGVVLVGVLLGTAAGSACTLTLDRSLSCGDGYVDIEAGEECDPASVDSYINECVLTSRPDGDAACDLQTCTIINTLEQCAVCGDGRVDESLGEQCDGDELNGASCPGGVGTLQCSTSCRFDTSACRNCGNGVLDPGEECDPNLDHGELTIKPPCVALDSPYGEDLPYTAGLAGACRDDCRRERTGCSYCGNGHIETDVFLIDFDGTTVIPEWCDGNDFDRVILEEQLAGSPCTRANEDLRPVVECASNCLDLITVETCCVKAGAGCPPEDAPAPCCFVFDNPGTTEDPCQVVFDNLGNVIEVCR
jgi:hypothetical protein